MCDEIILTGGRVTQGVTRKGEFVYRPCNANSAFVHDVLKWLEAKGCLCAPRFIGLSEDGREITTFLEGTAPDNLGDFTDEQIYEAGKVIKCLHTALTDFPDCSDGQVVCHNDLSPCNFMFIRQGDGSSVLLSNENKTDEPSPCLVGKPYAVFDWDAAALGDPIDDVAYAAWMWCDIGNDENSPALVSKKINVLLDAYELEQEKRSNFIEKIHSQIQRTAESLKVNNMLDGYNWALECGIWLNRTGLEQGDGSSVLSLTGEIEQMNRPPVLNLSPSHYSYTSISNIE